MKVYEQDAEVRMGNAHYDPNACGIQFIDPLALFNASSLFTQVVVSPPAIMIHVSGLIGCSADNRLVADDLSSQMRQAFENLKAAVVASCADIGEVVKLTVYIANYEDNQLPLLRGEIERLFASPPFPALTLVPVPRLGRAGALFEVDAVVAKRP